MLATGKFAKVLTAACSKMTVCLVNVLVIQGRSSIVFFRTTYSESRSDVLLSTCSRSDWIRLFLLNAQVVVISYLLI